MAGGATPVAQDFSPAVARVEPDFRLRAKLPPPLKLRRTAVASAEAVGPAVAGGATPVAQDFSPAVARVARDFRLRAKLPPPLKLRRTAVASAEAVSPAVVGGATLVAQDFSPAVARVAPDFRLRAKLPPPLKLRRTAVASAEAVRPAVADAAQALRPARAADQIPPAARSQDSSGSRALLEKVIAAKGGVDALRAVKTLSAITRSEMPAPSGNVSAEVTTYLQYPNRVRVETKIPGGTIVQIYDGAHGWIREGNTTRDVPPQMIRELEAGFRRDTVILLLAAHDGSVQPRVLPDTKDETGKLYHALELSALTLEPIVLYVDPETSLIARQTYVAGGPGQPLIDEMFDDYRVVDGVRIAFTARVRSSGQPMLERRVSEIKINPALDPKLFTRPSS